MRKSRLSSSPDNGKINAMHAQKFFLVLLLSVFPLFSSATIYKCLENGKIEYRQNPCSKLAEQEQIINNVGDEISPYSSESMPTVTYLDALMAGASLRELSHIPFSPEIFFGTEAFLMHREQSNFGISLEKPVVNIVSLEEQARVGDADAQVRLGLLLENGSPQHSIAVDFKKAFYWYEKAAKSDQPVAINNLGVMYYYGDGINNKNDSIGSNEEQEIKLFSRAAKLGNAAAQLNLGIRYLLDHTPNWLIWIERAAKQGNSRAQITLSALYFNDRLIPKDLTLAYAWASIAATNREQYALWFIKNELRPTMSDIELLDARRLEKALKSSIKKELAPVARKRPQTGSGSGFFISEYELLTNNHVVGNCENIFVFVDNQQYKANIKAADTVNDIALLTLNKHTIPMRATFRKKQSPKLAENILVAGYPLKGLLADSLNVTSGEISALAGLNNDSRYLQITAPVQPGNSGGPVLDKSGSVIGMVVSKLNAIWAVQKTGDIPQNISFAIKGKLLTNFLEKHSVSYQTTGFSRDKSPVDIADKASKYTASIECH